MKRSSRSNVNPTPSIDRRRSREDPREEVRIEHLLRMDYHVIPPQELEAMREVVLHSPRILKYEWATSNPSAMAAGAENEPAPIPEILDPLVQRLDRIERKLDALLEHHGVEAPGLKEKQRFNVTLSARGLRFRDHLKRCQAGDMVYLCLELPMNPTVEVMALAETLVMVEDSRLRRLSAGRDVVLEFRVIQEEARQLIDRYCRLNQEVRGRG
jgi:hypothetical protein